MYKEMRVKGTNQIFKLQQSIFDWLFSEEFNLYKEKIKICIKNATFNFLIIACKKYVFKFSSKCTKKKQSSFKSQLRPDISNKSLV